MNVMQINCVYQNGSTGKIVCDIHRILQKEGCGSVVCYGRGTKSGDTEVYKTCGEVQARLNKLYARLTGVKFGGCFFSTRKLLRKIKKVKPDIVHLHCINGYFVNIFRLIKYLKKHHIKTILTLHAEFMYTANCSYAIDCEKWRSGCGSCKRAKEETHTILFDRTDISWEKMKQAFNGFEDLLVVAVSPWVQSRAQQSPMLNDKRHMTILNGINTEIFSLRENQFVKKNLGLADKKIVFHVTSEFSECQEHIKGGYFVIKIAEYFLEVDPNVMFVVAGTCNNKLNLPANVILLGNVSDQRKLAEYYSMSDITLLTSKRETFSMVVAESLCCGTPVVGFEAGAPEMITIESFSSFVPYGDIRLLIDEVKRYLYFEYFDENHISKVAKQKYNSKMMGYEYLRLYKELID